jgi:hypothetical protein
MAPQECFEARPIWWLFGDGSEYHVPEVYKPTSELIEML